MIRFCTIIILLLCSTLLQAQKRKLIENTDIELFWNMYDKVSKTSDSTVAVQLIQSEYFDKGSAALKAIKNFNPFDNGTMYLMIKKSGLFKFHKTKHFGYPK